MPVKETNQQISFREAVEIIIKRRWHLIIPLVIVLISSIIFSNTLPKIYESSSIIQISEKKMMDSVVSRLTINPDLMSQISSWTKQITSWPQMIKLVEQLHLVDNIKSQVELEDFIIRMKERISINTRNSGLIQISYQDQDPARTQTVVNTLTKNFIEENTRIKRDEARNVIDFISEQLDIYRKKIEDTQKSFSISKIESDLKTAIDKKRFLEEKLSNLKKVIPTKVNLDKSMTNSRLQSHLADLEMELTKLLMDAKETYPRVIELKKQIEEIKKKISEEEEKSTINVPISNPEYFQTENELKQVEMDINYIERKQKDLERKNNEKLKAISENDIENIERSKNVNEDIYQMLLRQMETSYISEKLQDSDKGTKFTILEYARLPLKPIKPNKMKILLMGLLGGFASSFGLVFFLEYIDKSLRTIEDAKKFLKIQLLGSISRIVVKDNDKSKTPKKLLNETNKFSKMKFMSPHIARKVKDSDISAQAVIYHEPDSIISEEFRILRTNIQNIISDRPLKTIILTSTIHGEGKSTTSVNLSISLADFGKNTLLIDCDLRKGLDHGLLGLKKSPGLTDILSGKADVNSTLVKSKIKNLTIIPCGEKISSPSELLGSQKMEKLLNDLKSHFDIIILDTPPILGLPDSCILSKLVDGLIFIIQAERTQQEDITNAQARLIQSHANIMGFVLTNVQFYMPRYMYYYYYGES